MSDTDDVPDPIAELDQAAAQLRTQANLLAGYFHNLIEAGFTRPEALDLTRDFQESLNNGD
jgi:hypothetical protein